MPLKRENRRRQITLNVSPYVYDVDAVALSLINQFKADEAAPEITKLDEYKLSLTFRETDELTYEVACQKILWNQYVQNIEQKNVTNNIELLKKLVDPYFDSPVVASYDYDDDDIDLDGIPVIPWPTDDEATALHEMKEHYWHNPVEDVKSWHKYELEKDPNYSLTEDHRQAHETNQRGLLEDTWHIHG